MSIESVSSLKASEIGRATKGKPNVAKVEPAKADRAVPNQVSVIRAGGQEAFEKAETFNQFSSSTSTNSLHEKSAIAAYQSMLKEQQRQDIQLLLGVDTFV
ncbi:hypothetical protein [Paraglaciecola aestuariivivens]